MIIGLEIAGACGALLLSALASGMETGIYCLNRVRLRVRSARNEPAARRLAGLMQRPEELVITALLGTNIADYLAAACVSALLLHAGIGQNTVEIYATLILTPLILVFGGVIPKDWFRQRGDGLMYPLALPLLGLVRLARATGLVWALRRVTRLLNRLIDPARAQFDEGLLPRAKTLRLLHEGAARGGLTALQRDSLQRAITGPGCRLGSVLLRRPRVGDRLPVRGRRVLGPSPWLRSRRGTASSRAGTHDRRIDAGAGFRRHTTFPHRVCRRRRQRQRRPDEAAPARR